MLAVVAVVAVVVTVLSVVVAMVAVLLLHPSLQLLLHPLPPPVQPLLRGCCPEPTILAANQYTNHSAAAASSLPRCTTPVLQTLGW